MDTNIKPHMLVLQKHHLSREKAREQLIATLLQTGQTHPPTGWETVVVNWKAPLPEGKSTFNELLEEVRLNGIAINLQKSLDKKDSIFGGALDEMATSN